MGAVIDRASANELPIGAVLFSLQLPAVSMTQLAFYCGAAGVTDPIHYDRDLAKRLGFRDAVVNGSLRVGWMAEAAACLVAAPDSVRLLQCNHVRAMHVGDAPLIEIKLTSREAATDAQGEVMLLCALEMRVGKDVTDRGEARLGFVAASGEAIRQA